MHVQIQCISESLDPCHRNGLRSLSIETSLPDQVAGGCISDRLGRIWCSRYQDGDARITNEGQVLCGKGQCVEAGDEEIDCSSETGGAVLIDNRGNARCQG